MGKLGANMHLVVYVKRCMQTELRICMKVLSHSMWVGVLTAVLKYTCEGPFVFPFLGNTDSQTS